MRRPWIVMSLIGIAVAVGTLAAQERVVSREERVAHGRHMFVEQGCHGCHTVGKFGTPIGPDLSRAGAKYSESFLAAWLRDPAMQRPSAHMPALELTEPQIAALAAFLASLRE